MSGDEVDNNRRHFRIQYSSSERPVFIYKDKEFEITDISESGMNLVVDEEFTLVENQKVRGKIDFNGRNETEVKGIIRRIIDKQLAVEFIVGVPLNMIMTEQRYLIQRANLEVD